jgi:hypothetical protein
MHCPSLRPISHTVRRMITDPMDSPVPLVDPFGAVWCEIHGRRECAHMSKRSSARCHKNAISGMGCCDMHSGRSREVAKAQGQAALAWQLAQPGAPMVDHRHAVLAALQMTFARLAWYAWLLEQQVAAEGDEPDNTDDDGDPAELGVPGGTGGLIGHTFAGSKDGGRIVTGEAIRGLAVLEGQERDRVVRFAKVAHDMGIDDQMVRLEEQKGLLLVAGLRMVEAALGLSDVQVVAWQRAVPQMLRQLAAGEVPTIEGDTA